MIRLAPAIAATLTLVVSSARADAAPPRGQAAVLSWLRTELLQHPEPGFETPRVALAWADLNGDGRAEALAYVVGREWCGSGGCNLYVLEIHTDRIREHGSVMTSRPPIAVLDSRTRGFRDLSVKVCGGGVIHCYRARVRRDGDFYEASPSTAPVLPPDAREHVVIADTPQTISIADTEPYLSDIPHLRALQAPKDVKMFVDRRMGCMHWSGEDGGGEPGRAREIQRALRKLRCAQLAADEARLRVRHINDTALLRTLTETGDWMW